MKKISLLLTLVVSFGINAQISTNNTTASGWASTAMGTNTTASAPGSTAMGAYTTASGQNSQAMAWDTKAKGAASTATGRGTIASDYASLVVGQYNSSGSSVTNSATSFSTANTAFVIGNGVNSSNKSDAFKVMFSGDTYVSGSLYLAGSAITSTSAELNILDGVTATTAELNILDGVTANASEFNLLDGVTTIGDGILASVTENSNTGVRLSTSNASNHGEIGDAAVDLSKQGASSTTRGATGYGSLASGYNTTASESYSTALGSYTVASGYGSTALGRYTTASGYYSVTMGYSTTASDWGSLVIGRWNSSSSSATSSDSFSTSNPAFVIGNGTNSNSRSDAFKVMYNGDATVSNDLTVSGDVVISSDARLKSNIVSLGSTLSKLLLIDGKSYTMKGKQKIGVLAQEIKEVFPELVTKDENENLAVNYQGLVPVLINALKEQQAEIDRLKNQEERLERLEGLVAAMD